MALGVKPFDPKVAEAQVCELSLGGFNQRECVNAMGKAVRENRETA